jgi:hypothetical protein
MPARLVHLDYPRAAKPAADDLVGMPEMCELTGRSDDAVYQWFARRLLPYADGPKVWGRNTWRRRTFLAWAYRQGFTVDHKGGAPLACHDEAREWAEAVAPARTDRVVDVEARRALQDSA